VHSALISAALAGNLELVLELKQHSDPRQGLAAAPTDEDDYDDDVADKTEL